MKPSNAGQYGYRPGFEERYGILDNVNLKWNNIMDQPFSITAGRQDISLGDPDDWCLVLDGTPATVRDVLSGQHPDNLRIEGSQDQN